MSPLVKKKGEKFTIPSKYLLFALTFVCAMMIVLSLFTNVFEGILNRVAGNMIIPFQRGITYVGSFITDKADNLREIEALLEENSQLKTKVDELTLEINRLQQDKYELAHLQELFKLDAQYIGVAQFTVLCITAKTKLVQPFLFDVEVVFNRLDQRRVISLFARQFLKNIAGMHESTV